MSELPGARLVSAPGKPKEVLISDDPPESLAMREPALPAVLLDWLRRLMAA